MSWISKIVNGAPDDYSHARLVKYGIGAHPGPRAFLKLSKNSITFKADLDTEKIFIRGYLKGVPDGAQKVKGLVVSYKDRRSELSDLSMPITWKVSKGKGATTYKAKIDEIAPLSDIKGLVQIDDPTTFLLLSLNPRDGSKPWKIATKTSFPKGSKGVDDDDDDSDDDAAKEKPPAFTKGVLGNEPEVLELIIIDQLVPDVKDLITPKTKSIELRQIIIIESIEIPDDSSMSFAEKRKAAKKNGKLIRKIEIDGTEHVKEYSFLA